jgi:hypothetical protein
MSSFIFFKVLVKRTLSPLSTVDENLVKPGARDYRLQDERKTPWFREACPLIRAGEGNGYLLSVF